MLIPWAHLAGPETHRFVTSSQEQPKAFIPGCQVKSLRHDIKWKRRNWEALFEVNRNISPVLGYKETFPGRHWVFEDLQGHFKGRANWRRLSCPGKIIGRKIGPWSLPMVLNQLPARLSPSPPLFDFDLCYFNVFFSHRFFKKLNILILLHF